ncbi:carbohydrate kinase family protein [Brachybacterium huguangmaarense]
MTARFLTVGESLTDIVVAADGTRTEYAGGSPMNVSVALGRLGHDSHLLTSIGRDARGEQIRAHVEASGVRLTPGSIGERPTSSATARIQADGSARYVFDLAWDPDPRDLPDAIDAVHTSSIAAVLAPGASTVTDVVERFAPTATISYDPNVRPDLMGEPAEARRRIEALIARSHVVKSSDEDVAWLYDTTDVEDVVASWRELGPVVTAMTRGREGAVGFGPGGRVHVDPVRVEVADTVGAGDTFSAGILHALAERDLLGAGRLEALRTVSADDLAAILGFAARSAAVTVSRPGANPPRIDELD